VIEMGLKEEIKSNIIRSGLAMNEVVNHINEKYNRSDSLANLSNKLSRGTIKYSEVKEIAEAIGYEIVWQPKEK
jgi:hypothetical protein